MKPMKTVDLVRKKRDGGTLTREEIEYLIQGYVNGEIPDYQVSALLMAVFFRGMTDEETAVLTDVMAHSGTMLDLSFLGGFPVDKHSTGGVGDKTTLVLIPLLAASGLVVAKLSGRALGHTGGTIDKLESIPGLRTDLSREEFLRLVERSGLALADHTADMVPADRLLYELRDVTSTVDSLPLIVASILSKKVAGGARGIVIDVKTGSGAFLPKLEDSRRLATSLVSIGARLGRRISALITDMSQPLGHRVGNALEVREAIEALKGEGPKDLETLCCELGTELLLAAGKAADRQSALSTLEGLLRDGRALAKFEELVKNQGGDPRVIDDPDLLPRATKRIALEAPRSGTVSRLDALAVGRAANLLGAGRFVKEDRIDPAVGVELVHKAGDAVKDGESLAILHVNDETNLAQARALVEGAYTFVEGPVAPPPLIVERIPAPPIP
jgi:pyrimidine-nucleoside phosphorylase